MISLQNIVLEAVSFRIDYMLKSLLNPSTKKNICTFLHRAVYCSSSFSIALLSLCRTVTNVHYGYLNSPLRAYLIPTWMSNSLNKFVHKIEIHRPWNQRSPLRQISSTVTFAALIYIFNLVTDTSPSFRSI